MYLIDPRLPQFKANLHCHSTLSDGKRTPQQLVQMYRDRGYQVLAITDHEYPMDHSALSGPEFLLLTGYEVYIREHPEGKYDPYLSEVHLNLFARDPHNQTLIAHDPRYCRYLERTPNPAVTHAGSPLPRQYSPAYINRFIADARQAGYLVAYNHPYWSLEQEADILAYEGLFSLEIANWGSLVENRLDYAGGLYDRMLRRGRRLCCHSGDDNHNGRPEDHPQWDSFGAYTMILAPELTYGPVFSAMEQGQMYSSLGPAFREVSMEGSRIHIECSPVSFITVFTGSKKPLALHARPGQLLTQADFTVDDRALYVRVNISDSQGRCADTRAFFRDELEF